MAIDRSVKIKNYKCFGEEAQGFEKIYPINIIIGKNNSGKSSLIDLIEYLVEPKKDLIEAKVNSQCIIGLTISDKIVEEVIDHYVKVQSGNRLAWEVNIKRYSIGFINNEVKFKLLPDNTTEFVSAQIHYGQYEKSFMRVFDSFYRDRTFKRINAERDIRVESTSQDPKLPIKANGEGATAAIKQIEHHRDFDTNIIKKLLKNELNEILGPDIIVTDIHAQEISESKPGSIIPNYEIYLSTSSHEEHIAISKMGSGIKTILLVLLNLIVVPKIEHKEKKNLFFGFEELENNLHPSLQRRLFNYISKYARENGAIFFITTHSSVIIDLFSSDKNAQIIHVEQNGKNSTARTIETKFDNISILNDLGYKASDLLLSNGIVWVEGPSDAIYLELLLELYSQSVDGDLQKLNYTIQVLSTAIWKYAGFVDFDWNKVETNIRNQIISLAKLNHNHLLIIDNDGNYEDKKPSEYEVFLDGTGKNKALLIHESMKYGGRIESMLSNNYGDSNDGKLFYWINEGTFETYLKEFISNKGKDNFERFFEVNSKFKYLEKKRSGNDSSISKVELAANIAKYCLEEKLVIDDFAPKDSPLFNKIERLYKTIKESWN
jgi:putative ATP-dependent endonuclease of OLD family